MELDYSYSDLTDFEPAEYTVKEVRAWVRETVAGLEAEAEASPEAFARGFRSPLLSDRVNDLIQLLSRDQRKGVQKLAASLEKKQEAVVSDIQAWQQRELITDKIKQAGYTFICGIDEAGRGPLAGPVAAGAVILPPDCYIPGLDDSKKLSPARREELAVIIEEVAVASAVGLIDNETIDEVNIHQAVRLAARSALSQLEQAPDYLLLDGGLDLQVNLPQQAITQGDARVNAIAAASILAKVKRDSLMDEYHQDYPQYNFINNKGYGTADHIAAIQEHGRSPLHRRSFSVPGLA